MRLGSTNLVSPWPLDIAWFCSGHSPPLSQTGQSSGWLISSNSITPRCAFSATGEVSWVCTTMPSATSIVHEACGFGTRPLPASGMSTRHWRQAPTGSSSGWSQKRGIWMPSSSAARITRVPLGTLTWKPSMVRVTRSAFSTAPAPGGWSETVMQWLPRGNRVDAAGRTGSRPREVRKVLVAEVLDRRVDRARRAVAERAERAAEDVGGRRPAPLRPPGPVLLCDNILGRAFCALGDGATSPITSSIQYFRDEYLAHLTEGGCPFDPAASTLFATRGSPCMSLSTNRPDAVPSRRRTWSP